MTLTQSIASPLVLLVILSGCVCDVSVSVWQTPAFISAAPGERVNITCHFSSVFTHRTSEQWKIMWWKNNETAFKNKTVISDIKPNTAAHGSRSHTLLLHPVSERDSGVYYCTVWQEIPHLTEKTSGEGTQLIVNSTGLNSTAPGLTPLIWTLLLASVLLVCVVSVTCCFKHRGSCMRRKKESQSECGADNGVLYSVVNLKRTEKKNTQEVSEAPDAGCEEVLYSKIHFKS